MYKFNTWKMIRIVIPLCAVAIALPGQIFTTLGNFNGVNGANPQAPLVQGLDGNLYGTTGWGGGSSNCTHGCGTIFKTTPGGTLTTLHSFDMTDGAGPFAGLLEGTNGSFYGTTTYGVTPSNCSRIGCGTIFKATPSGALTRTYNFTGGMDGSNPNGLVLAANGDFYGTTNGGGIYDKGTIFRITPGGTLTTLYDFTGGVDGGSPQVGLAQGAGSNFYGTTVYGGVINCGTVFELKSGGALTTLHSFDYDDGCYPNGSLARASNGYLYGTTEVGGVSGDGTIFKINQGGTFTALYNFRVFVESCG